MFPEFELLQIGPRLPKVGFPLWKNKVCRIEIEQGFSDMQKSMSLHWEMCVSRVRVFTKFVVCSSDGPWAAVKQRSSLDKKQGLVALEWLATACSLAIVDFLLVGGALTS